MPSALRIPLSLLGVVVCVFVWSAINPYERVTWWMEIAPVIIALPLLIGTYRQFRLTDMLYVSSF